MQELSLNHKESETRKQLRIKYFDELISQKESESPIEQQINDIVNKLKEEEDKNQKLLIDLLIDCSIHLPFKTPFYATIIGLLNNKNYELGKESIRIVIEYLFRFISNAKFYEANSTLRFIGDLVRNNVLKLNSYITLLETLSNYLIENQTQSTKDFFAKLILGSLLFNGSLFISEKKENVKQLLGRIEMYISSRNYSGLKYVSMLKINEEENLPEDQLQNLFRIVNECRDNSWKLNILPDYSINFLTILNTNEVHEMQKLTIPTKFNDNFTMTTPIFPFYSKEYRSKDKIVLNSDVLALRILIEENLKFLDENSSQAVTEMMSFPLHQSIEKSTFYQIIVETSFAQIFILPRSPSHLMYYTRTFIHLFRESKIPPRLGILIDSCFQKLTLFETECYYRFVEWFAVHLSNFQFIWKWESWGEVVELNPTNTKRKFINDILVRCIRLSYHKRILQALPEKMKILMPPIVEPKFSYLGISSVEAKTQEEKEKQELHNKVAIKSTELLSKLQNKEQPEKIIHWLDTEIIPSIPFDTVIDMTTQALLQSGSKSFTHIFAKIEKYSPILIHLNKLPKQKQAIVSIVYQFWQKSAQHISLIMNKFLELNIIDIQSIINWFISIENKQLFHSSSLWEILSNALIHSTRRSRIVRKKKQKKQETEDEKKQVIGEDEFGSDSDLQMDVDLENVYSEVINEEKEIFLNLIQKFFVVISSHMEISDKNQANPFDSWFDEVSGLLFALVRRYHKQVIGCLNLLDSVLPSKPDRRVVTLFESIKEMVRFLN